MLVRFLVNHPAIHRVVHRLTARGPGIVTIEGFIQYPTCILDRIVWSKLTDDSAFLARLERERLS